jgi:hypothetical protein
LRGSALDRDLDVLPERGQKAHQALAGEVGAPPVEQRRDLGLVDAHERRGRHLGQATAPDDLPDMARELRLGQLFLGFGEPQIGEHVAAARRHRDLGRGLGPGFVLSLLDYCS